MRKSILFILLLSFLYQNTSSIWIITSFYINQDYIAKNICVNRFDLIPVCNGKCYLQKELSADSEKEKQIPNIKVQEVQPLFCQIIYQYTLETLTVVHLIYPEYSSEFLVSNMISSVFQPPELI
ncbi:hypothetical protein AS589_16080 [Empedobacter brevis]|nr:hypothetical protein AS589_16080 [Empedobacter brevis]